MSPCWLLNIAQTCRSLGLSIFTKRKNRPENANGINSSAQCPVRSCRTAPSPHSTAASHRSAWLVWLLTVERKLCSMVKARAPEISSYRSYKPWVHAKYQEFGCFSLSFISDFHLLSAQLSRINLDQIHFFDG